MPGVEGSLGCSTDSSVPHAFTIKEEETPLGPVRNRKAISRASSGQRSADSEQPRASAAASPYEGQAQRPLMRSRSPGGPAFFIPIPNGAGPGAGVGQPRVASVPNQPALMAGPVNANGAVDAPQGRGQPPSLEDIYTTTWHEPNLLAVGQGQPQAQPLFPGKPTGYGKGQGPAARAIAAHPANELQPTGPDGSVLPAVLDDGPRPLRP